MPVLAVVLVLAFGMGMFWSVQGFLDSCQNSLISKATELMQDYSIRADNHGRGGKTDLESRFRVSKKDAGEIIKKIIPLGELVCEPMIRKPDFTLMSNDELAVGYKCTLIGCDIAAEKPVLPVLDSVSVAPKYLSNKAMPAIISSGLFPEAAVGKEYSFVIGGKESSIVIADILPKNQLFSVPTMVVPVEAARGMINADGYDYVGIRDLEQRSHKKMIKQLEATLGEHFLVSHWSSSLKTVNSFFNGFNVIISSIVSSLFFIAFFFLVVMNDLLLKKKRKQLALLLALGMPPKKIQSALIWLAVLLGAAGVMLGTLFAFVNLEFMAYTPLNSVMAAFCLGDLSFSFQPVKLVFLATISLIITIGAACWAARGICKIDPIEDLRR